MSQLHSLQGNLSENRYNMQFNFEHLLNNIKTLNLELGTLNLEPAKPPSTLIPQP